METSETSINYQNESSTGAASTTVMTNLDAQTARPVYTVPGILHYLQHEWNRFEIERQQWDTERAELQVSKRGEIFQRENISFSRLGSLFYKVNDKDKKILKRRSFVE